MFENRAYEKIKRAIYRGRLPAGKRIVERDLARRFDISRIPLRESLVRLQAEGLVRSVPYSSTFIEDFEPRDVLEIYSLRLVFEPLATRLLAKHPTQTVLDRLCRLCDRMAQVSSRPNPIALDRADYEFHHVIVEAARHKRLLRAYDSAHICIVSPRTGYALLRARPPELVAREHLEVVEKIREQDLDGAERVARIHVERSIRSFEKILGATLDNADTSPTKK